MDRGPPYDAPAHGHPFDDEHPPEDDGYGAYDAGGGGAAGGAGTPPASLIADPYGDPYGDPAQPDPYAEGPDPYAEPELGDPYAGGGGGGAPAAQTPIDAFLSGFRDMPLAEAKASCAAQGTVQFKEELHEKKWVKRIMVVTPPEPVAVDDGELVQALLLFDPGKRSDRSGAGPMTIKPLRNCTVDLAERGDKGVNLKRGVTTGFVVTLSTPFNAGAPLHADEFAFSVEKKLKEGEAGQAQWQEVFGRVRGEAALLKQGRLELQAYKLQKTATYEFELRGPVLSYYTDDGHRKKMGAIHFEDRENTEVMPSKVSSHAHPPRLRVQCLTGAVLGARTTRRCSKCCR